MSHISYRKLFAGCVGFFAGIVAAPELYECLREAVFEDCRICTADEIAKCRGKCNVAKWRDALAKAAGESEVK